MQHDPINHNSFLNTSIAERMTVPFLFQLRRTLLVRKDREREREGEKKQNVHPQSVIHGDSCFR